MQHAFIFDGEAPDIKPDDVVETTDDIAYGDVVVFERINPQTVAFRLLDPAEVTTIPLPVYRLEKSPENGKPIFVQLSLPSLEPLRSCSQPPCGS